ncbi:MAG: hypothetical protein HYU26_07020 [Candidatus Rokubacteria bacterium]|nr:hypothetical protein [Candidatus Rokubacteria bacterium]
MRFVPLFAATAVVMFASSAISSAASPCPPEVKEARQLLTAKSKTATPSKTLAAARGQQDTQAPRGQQDTQAPRGQQDTQAPRGQQDTQAPRGQQDTQAPRGQQDTQAPRVRQQDIQVPRGQQDIQAPRGQQDIQAPRNVAKGRVNALANARRLVNEAETACKDADAQRALANAHAALELLKYVP